MDHSWINGWSSCRISSPICPVTSSSKKRLPRRSKRMSSVLESEPVWGRLYSTMPDERVMLDETVVGDSDVVVGVVGAPGTPGWVVRDALTLVSMGVTCVVTPCAFL